MRSRERRPGRVPPRHRPEQSNGRPFNANANQSLAVDLGGPLRTWRDLIARVMTQMPAGTAAPYCEVVLLWPRSPRTLNMDAQDLADQRGEPCALIDGNGCLLAYRKPATA